MKFVPQTSTNISKNVARDAGKDEESAGGYGIKRSDDIDWPDHVRPENEIEQRLRPTRSNKRHPDDMPSPDERCDEETDFVWINHVGTLILSKTFLEAPIELLSN
jgi:hypothetical protein